MGIWMYWGEEYVPLRQAHRAILRHLGDPQSRTYARDAPRASKDRARDAHLFAYAEYVAMRRALEASAPSGVPQLYAPVTAEDTLANCCGNLLSALGLEILYPEQAERMRQARSWMLRPGPAAHGLTT